MEQRLITKESRDLAVFDQLFIEAFPPSERVLPSTLVNVEFIKPLGFYEDGKPVGMMVIINKYDFVFILFLATFSEYRGQGIGSKIINAFYDSNPDILTVGSIEKPDDNAENNAQRLSRQRFYERLGYTIHDLGIKFNGGDFLTIAKGKGSDNKETVAQQLNKLQSVVPEMLSAFGK
ncbi:MAG: GNAT family N-acetyltransferase [Bacteroidales bacterium]|nr:GNAT family N-acetyltransferase [Bacteroidales bacterium]